MKAIYQNLFLIILLLFSVRGDSISESYRGLDIILSMPAFNYALNEEIIISIHVKNTTNDVISFTVYDSPERSDIYDRPRGDISGYTTFQPVVYDMHGRSAELIVPYIIESKDMTETLSWMVKREIRLGPGETFIRTQNLKNIFRFASNRDYRMKLNFFPDLGGDKSSSMLMSSNEIRFRVMPEKVYAPLDKADPSSIMLTPSEVVLLVLSAEYENRFSRGIKYIDIEKFINSYPEFTRRYNLADDEGKKIIEKEFIRYLSLKRNDYLMSFEIRGEELLESGTIAYVDVIAERKSVVRPDRYRYRYRLEKRNASDKIWLLAGLEASVIKDVKR